jgi:hypothetical protein
VTLLATIVLAFSAPPAGDCPTTYSRADFHRVARRAFDGVASATDHERRTLHRVVRCQRRPASAPLVRFHADRYRRSHRLSLAIREVTPYDCGAIGSYAIPCSIVACESGPTTAVPKRWSTVNPIGALGPYQFLNKPVPWPVRTGADRLAHHRKAAELWASGAGASHWTECL